MRGHHEVAIRAGLAFAEIGPLPFPTVPHELAWSEGGLVPSCSAAAAGRSCWTPLRARDTMLGSEMIIRHLNSELLLITQVDHAALAGRIMSVWRADGFPERPTRSRVLDATRHHDLGWQMVDAEPCIDPQTGTPYGFVNAPLAVRQGVWMRALAQLAPQDPYVGALVAHHAFTVYRRYAATAGWETFFPDMERRRDELLATQAIHFDCFLKDYAIVGVGDLCSLAYCDGWLEPQSRGGYQVTLHGRAIPQQRAADVYDTGWLEITPDPFDGATLSLEVRARRVPARRYRSDADLRDIVARAPIVRLTAIAAGPRRRAPCPTA